MKKIVITAALAAIALPTAASAQRLGAPVIMVVNTDRISGECTACVAARNQLKQQADQMQQRAAQLGQPIDAEAAALRKELAGKDPTPAQQTRIQALASKQSAAQQEMQGREAGFNRNRAYVSKQINDKLMPIINQVMSARGANIAVDSQATLAASPALDVTNDVLAALNQQLPSVSVTAPAAPAQPAGR